MVNSDKVIKNILGNNIKQDCISKNKEDKLDYCPLCGRKVGKGNYDKKYGCSECADLSELYGAVKPWL